ncbi:glutathione S-transferase [Auriculariales sp. MPI-PUGE-AT-0066]|nr:glutathione S-transferase [Auriculariales sp. MPI-PUGE-AT-0066]
MSTSHVQRDTSQQSSLDTLIAPGKTQFDRAPSSFRDTISCEPGAKFTPEKGRYHLYVSYGCPWATRTIIVRALKGLHEIIGMTVVGPVMGEHGWSFAKVDPYPGTQDDPNEGTSYLCELYLIAEPGYSGRFTVPVLWDTRTRTIVNNESSEIIRILNDAFNDLLPVGAPEKMRDLYPESLRSEIDELNGWVYNTVNNGVYKAGFAKSQDSYEAAVGPLFTSLDRLERILEGKDFLVGGQLTEADVRLFATTIRFDVAYYGLFKCNLRTIRDGYPQINRWMKQLYWNNESFRTATKFDFIKNGYYKTMKHINPTGIVPLGPVPDIEQL